MLRDCGTAHRKRPDKLADRGLAARKPPKDGSAGGIGDSGEGGSDAVNGHRG
jgi:hypothetical protein